MAAVDNLSPEKRSKVMRGVKPKNTKPELLVRRALHGLGYRFRLHGVGLFGKPDIVFKARRKVIFVHGCFWHQHSSPDCKDFRRPTSNVAYWNEKLDRNVERDRRVEHDLIASGWEVLSVWECETRDPDLLRTRLTQFLGLTKHKS